MRTLICEKCGDKIRAIAKYGYHTTCPKKEIGKPFPQYLPEEDK
jgi:hypothetical protein